MIGLTASLGSAPTSDPLNPAAGGGTEGAARSTGGDGRRRFAALIGGMLARPDGGDLPEALRGLGLDEGALGRMLEALRSGSDGEGESPFGDLRISDELSRRIGEILEGFRGEADEGATESADEADGTDEAAGIIAGSSVISDLGLLSPTLRDRLMRVRDRMREEFGHEVRVVETLRTEERQLDLYRQGRSEPGLVVTWTTRSEHMSGRAVDVIVDETYDNPEAYERLQRVASEEGLQTLGPADGGHLQLPDGVDEGTEAREAGRRRPGMARLARVARRAGMARRADAPGGREAPVPDMPDPAPVAAPDPVVVEAPDLTLTGVARDPRPAAPDDSTVVGQHPETPPARGDQAPRPDGIPSPDDIPEVEDVRRPELLRERAAVASTLEGARTSMVREPAGEGTGESTGPRPAGPELASSIDGRANADRDGGSESRDRESGERPQGEGDLDAVRASRVDEGSGPREARAGDDDPQLRIEKLFTRAQRDHAGQAGATQRIAGAENAASRAESVGAPGAAHAVERVAQVRELQLDGRPSTVSRLVVQMPDGAGALDVSSRGDLLSARIDAHESALADRLRMHVDELRQGLSSRGLRAETLNIRDTQAAELLRSLGAPTAPTGQTIETGTATAGRDFGGDQGPQRDPGRQPDDARPDRGRREAREQRDRRNS